MPKQLFEIKENKFKNIFNKFKLLSKEKQDIESKRYRTEDKIRKLEWKRDKELREQKETHTKVENKFSLDIDTIHVNMTSDSKSAYRKLMTKLNPKGDDIIAGKLFEKELSKFKNIQKTKIRMLIISRNNYIRIKMIKPKKISFKYNKQIRIELDKKKKLTEDIWDSRKKINPYIQIIRITDNNRNKIKGNKRKIREINKKYRELEKKEKPVWEGMRQADEYYSKKERIEDKFITLDIRRDKLEKKIDKLAKETNKELYKKI